MRAESDLQGHHRSGSEGCHRCGLPLIAEAQYCPYCERWLSEGPLRRLWAGRRRVAALATSGLSERTVLLAGLALSGLVAAVCVVAAAIVA